MEALQQIEKDVIEQVRDVREYTRHMRPQPKVEAWGRSMLRISGDMSYWKHLEDTFGLRCVGFDSDFTYFEAATVIDTLKSHLRRLYSPVEVQFWGKTQVRITLDATVDDGPMFALVKRLFPNWEFIASIAAANDEEEYFFEVP